MTPGLVPERRGALVLMVLFAGGALVLLQPERFGAPGRAAAEEEGGEGEEEGRCADTLASTAPRSKARYPQLCVRASRNQFDQV